MSVLIPATPSSQINQDLTDSNTSSNAAVAENETVLPGPVFSSNSPDTENHPKFSKTAIKEQFLKKHLTTTSRRGDNLTTVYTSNLDEGGDKSRIGYAHEIDPILDYLFAKNLGAAKSPVFKRGNTSTKNNNMTKALTSFIVSDILRGNLNDEVQKTYPVLYGKAYAMTHGFKSRMERAKKKTSSMKEQSGAQRNPKVRIAFSKWNKTVPF